MSDTQAISIESYREILVNWGGAVASGFSEGAARFIDAVNAELARTALAIDLDGDGIETVGIGGAPVLFDHDGDGLRSGTGWLKTDDGWLVRDLNGNGQIDSGRELLGADTQLVVGGVARNASSGFEALAALDTNADGVFDALDAAFAELRIWRDLNQDGLARRLGGVANRPTARWARHARSQAAQAGAFA